MRGAAGLRYISRTNPKTKKEGKKKKRKKKKIDDGPARWLTAHPSTKASTCHCPREGVHPTSEIDDFLQ